MSGSYSEQQAGDLLQQKYNQVAKARNTKQAQFSGSDLSMDLNQFRQAYPESTPEQESQFLRQQRGLNQNGLQDFFSGAEIAFKDNVPMLAKTAAGLVTGDDKWFAAARQEQAEAAQRKQAYSAGTQEDLEAIQQASAERKARLDKQGASGLSRTAEEFFGATGDYIKNPMAAMTLAAENSDSIVTMPVGGALVSGGAKMIAKAGIKSALKKELGEEFTKAAFKAKLAESATDMALKGSNAAGRAGMAYTGYAEGAGNAQGTYDKIMSMDMGDLQHSEKFQQAKSENPDLSDEEVRQQLATTAARKTGVLAGVAGVAVGKVTGATDTFSKALLKNKSGTGLAGSSLLKDTSKDGVIKAGLKGAAKEYPEEVLQEGGGQLISNWNVSDVDKNQNVLEGVGEQAAAGGIAGAVSGGATAAAARTVTKPLDKMGEWGQARAEKLALKKASERDARVKRTAEQAAFKEQATKNAKAFKTEPTEEESKNTEDLVSDIKVSNQEYTPHDDKVKETINTVNAWADGFHSAVKPLEADTLPGIVQAISAAKIYGDTAKESIEAQLAREDLDDKDREHLEKVAERFTQVDNDAIYHRVNKVINNNPVLLDAVNKTLQAIAAKDEDAVNEAAEQFLGNVDDIDEAVTSIIATRLYSRGFYSEDYSAEGLHNLAERVKESDPDSAKELELIASWKDVNSEIKSGRKAKDGTSHAWYKGVDEHIADISAGLQSGDSEAVAHSADRLHNFASSQVEKYNAIKSKYLEWIKGDMKSPLVVTYREYEGEHDGNKGTWQIRPTRSVRYKNSTQTLLDTMDREIPLIQKAATYADNLISGGTQEETDQSGSATTEVPPVQQPAPKAPDAPTTPTVADGKVVFNKKSYTITGGKVFDSSGSPVADANLATNILHKHAAMAGKTSAQQPAQTEPAKEGSGKQKVFNTRFGDVNKAVSKSVTEVDALGDVPANLDQDGAVKFLNAINQYNERIRKGIERGEISPEVAKNLEAHSAELTAKIEKQGWSIDSPKRGTHHVDGAIVEILNILDPKGEAAYDYKAGSAPLVYENIRVPAIYKTDAEGKQRLVQKAVVDARTPTQSEGEAFVKKDAENARRIAAKKAKLKANAEPAKRTVLGTIKPKRARLTYTIYSDGTVESSSGNKVNKTAKAKVLAQFEEENAKNKTPEPEGESTPITPEPENTTAPTPNTDAQSEPSGSQNAVDDDAAEVAKVAEALGMGDEHGYGSVEEVIEAAESQAGELWDYIQYEASGPDKAELTVEYLKLVATIAKFESPTEPVKPRVKRTVKSFADLPVYDDRQPTMTYAGVGSRETPQLILDVMKAIAGVLGKDYTLNSGDAKGADTAFISGAPAGTSNKFTAKDATPVTITIAKEVHPNPSALSGFPLNLMARNTFQIFGRDLNTPVDFLICWTHNGETEAADRVYKKGSKTNTGGTGQAIALASLKGIPVINLANFAESNSHDEILAAVLAEIERIKSATDDSAENTAARVALYGMGLDEPSSDHIATHVDLSEGAELATQASLAKAEKAKQEAEDSKLQAVQDKAEKEIKGLMEQVIEAEKFIDHHSKNETLSDTEKETLIRTHQINIKQLNEQIAAIAKKLKKRRLYTAEGIDWDTSVSTYDADAPIVTSARSFLLGALTSISSEPVLKLIAPYIFKAEPEKVARWLAYTMVNGKPVINQGLVEKALKEYSLDDLKNLYDTLYNNTPLTLKDKAAITAFVKEQAGVTWAYANEAVVSTWDEIPDQKAADEFTYVSNKGKPTEAVVGEGLGFKYRILNRFKAAIRRFIPSPIWDISKSGKSPIDEIAGVNTNVTNSDIAKLLKDLGVFTDDLNLSDFRQIRALKDKRNWFEALANEQLAKMRTIMQNPPVSGAKLVRHNALSELLVTTEKGDTSNNLVPQRVMDALFVAYLQATSAIGSGTFVPPKDIAQLLKVSDTVELAGIDHANLLSQIGMVISAESMGSSFQRTLGVVLDDTLPESVSESVMVASGNMLLNILTLDPEVYSRKVSLSTLNSEGESKIYTGYTLFDTAGKIGGKTLNELHNEWDKLIDAEYPANTAKILKFRRVTKPYEGSKFLAHNIEGNRPLVHLADATNVEPDNYIGNNVPKDIAPKGKITPEMAEAENLASKIEHEENELVSSFNEVALGGLDNFMKLNGETTEDDLALMNVNQARGLRGVNLGLRHSYQKLQAGFAKVRSLPEGTPKVIRFRSRYAEQLRGVVQGSINYMLDKYHRSALRLVKAPVLENFNPFDPKQEFKAATEKYFLLALGANLGLGAGVDKQDNLLTIKLAKQLFQKPHEDDDKDVVTARYLAKELMHYMNAEGVFVKPIEADTLEAFRDAAGGNWEHQSAILELARVMKLTNKGEKPATFKHSLKIEMDGRTNGPFHTILTMGLADMPMSDVIQMMDKSGVYQVSSEHENETAEEIRNRVKDSQTRVYEDAHGENPKTSDHYTSVSEGANTRLNNLKESLQSVVEDTAGTPEEWRGKRAETTLFTLKFLSEISKVIDVQNSGDGTYKITVLRNGTKNPVTVTVYGGGETGIWRGFISGAGQGVTGIRDILYAHMSDLNKITHEAINSSSESQRVKLHRQLNSGKFHADDSMTIRETMQGWARVVGNLQEDRLKTQEKNDKITFAPYKEYLKLIKAVRANDKNALNYSKKVFTGYTLSDPEYAGLLQGVSTTIGKAVTSSINEYFKHSKRSSDLMNFGINLMVEQANHMFQDAYLQVLDKRIKEDKIAPTDTLSKADLKAILAKVQAVFPNVQLNVSGSYANLGDVRDKRKMLNRKDIVTAPSIRNTALVNPVEYSPSTKALGVAGVRSIPLITISVDANTQILNHRLQALHAEYINMLDAIDHTASARLRSGSEIFNVAEYMSVSNADTLGNVIKAIEKAMGAGLTPIQIEEGISVQSPMALLAHMGALSNQGNVVHPIMENYAQMVKQLGMKYQGELLGLMDVKNADKYISDMIEQLRIQRDKTRVMRSKYFTDTDYVYFQQMAGINQGGALIQKGEVVLSDEAKADLGESGVAIVEAFNKEIGRTMNAVISSQVQGVESKADKVLATPNKSFVARLDSLKRTKQAAEEATNPVERASLFSLYKELRDGLNEQYSPIPKKSTMFNSLGEEVEVDSTPLWHNLRTTFNSHNGTFTVDSSKDLLNRFFHSFLGVTPEDLSNNPNFSGYKDLLSIFGAREKEGKGFTSLGITADNFAKLLSFATNKLQIEVAENLDKDVHGDFIPATKFNEKHRIIISSGLSVEEASNALAHELTHFILSSGASLAAIGFTASLDPTNKTKYAQEDAELGASVIAQAARYLKFIHKHNATTDNIAYSNILGYFNAYLEKKKAYLAEPGNAKAKQELTEAVYVLVQEFHAEMNTDQTYGQAFLDESTDKLVLSRFLVDAAKKYLNVLKSYLNKKFGLKVSEAEFSMIRTERDLFNTTNSVFMGKVGATTRVNTKLQSKGFASSMVGRFLEGAKTEGMNPDKAQMIGGALHELNSEFLAKRNTDQLGHLIDTDKGIFDQDIVDNFVTELANLGVNLSGSEQYALDNIALVLSHGAKHGWYSRNDAKRLIHAARKQVSPEKLASVLGVEPENAKVLHATLFSSDTTQDITNFLAFVRINPEMHKILDNVDYSLPTEAKETNLIDRIIQLISHALKTAGRKLAGLKGTSEDFDRIFVLLNKAALRYDYSKESSVKKLENTANGSVYKLGSAVVNAALKGAASLAPKYAATFNALQKSSDKHEVINKTRRNYIGSGKEGKRLGILSEPFNFMFSNGDKQADDLELHKDKLKHHVDAKAQQGAQVVREYVEGGFKTKLTPEESQAVTYLLRTDPKALLDQGMSLKEIKSLLTEPEKADWLLAKTIAELKATGIPTKYFNLMVNEARSLGKRMVLGGADQRGFNLPNAYMISSLGGTGLLLPDSVVDKQEVIFNLVDKIASLEALKTLPDNEVENLVQVMGRELTTQQNGLEKAIAVNTSIQTKLKEQHSAALIERIYPKGYLPNQSTSNESLRLVRESDLEGMEGFEVVKTLARDDQDVHQDKLVLVRSPQGAALTYVQGAMSTIESTLFGWVKADGKLSDKSMIYYSSSSAQRKITQRKSSSIGNSTMRALREPEISTGMVPNINAMGKVVGYRYDVPFKVKDTYLKYDQQVHHVLSSYELRSIQEEGAIEFNATLVMILADSYNSASEEAKKTQFVKLYAESDDPYLREIYKVIPVEIRRMFKKTFGANIIYVNRNDLTAAFGFRETSVVKLWANQEPNSVKNVITSLIEAVLGKNAINKLRYTERLIQEGVTSAKILIAIKSVVVPMGNIASNIAELLNLEVPVSAIAKDGLTAINGLKAYTKDIHELNALLLEKRVRDLTPKEVGRVNELKGDIESNPVKFIIDEGLNPAIVEDLGDKPENSLLADYVPNWWKNNDNLAIQATKEVLITEDSKTFGALNTLMSMGDFVGKYVYFKHCVNTGMSQEDAIKEARDAFINYSKQKSQLLHYAEKTGFAYFLSFFMGIQKVLYRMLVRNPVRFLLGAAAIVPTGLPSVFDAALGMKDISTSVGPLDLLGMASDAHPLI